MARKKTALPEDPRVEKARALLMAFESGNEELADKILDEITSMREAGLFQELGRLTRQLHDAMRDFALDTRLEEFTEKEIPDAKERLNYVITMTEQAANTTLNAIEEILPVSENLSDQACELARQWQRFRSREMSIEEFRDVSQKIADFFEQTPLQIKEINHQLNDVLMAQGFQDLTGQIIRRVINLVQDMEQSMVALIRISGARFATSTNTEPKSEVVGTELAGPAVPGLDVENTVHSQDDVDDLLSSLGF